MPGALAHTRYHPLAHCCHISHIGLHTTAWHHINLPSHPPLQWYGLLYLIYMAIFMIVGSAVRLQYFIRNSYGEAKS